MKKENNNVLALASINATIISIFIAVFSSFGIYMHNLREQSRDNIVQEANKAEEIANWSMSIPQGSSEICGEIKGYDWKQLLEKIETKCQSKDAINEVFCIAYIFQNKYPFVWQDDISRMTEGYRKFRFRNYEEVEAWIEDYRFVRNKISSCISSKEIELNDFYKNTNWGNSAKDYMNNFYRKIEELNKYVAYIDSLRQQSKANKYSIFQNSLIMALFIALSGLAFFCGVIWPMINQNINRIVLLWIPMGYYAILFFYLFMVFL